MGGSRGECMCEVSLPLYTFYYHLLFQWPSITSHAILSAENVFKSELPHSSSFRVSRVGCGGAENRVTKIRSKKKQKTVLSLIPASLGWHSLFFWGGGGVGAGAGKLELKSQRRIDQKKKNWPGLVAFHKNMATSGNTVLINIHAQPQSWAAATPGGGACALPMNTVPFLCIYSTLSVSLSVVFTWPLLALEAETPDGYQGVSHMADA